MFDLDFLIADIFEECVPLVVWFGFFGSGTGGDIESRPRFLIAVYKRIKNRFLTCVYNQSTIHIKSLSISSEKVSDRRE